MHRMKPITVAQYGLGPIGAETLRLLLTKPWVKLVAAVDIDPAKIGRDAGEVVGLGREVGLKVTSTLQAKPEVVVHTTGSRLRDVAGQLRDLLEHGCYVVSTCEELAFPLDATIREDLMHVARSHNVALLGTGVNPGFLMDKLPLTLTGVCQEVKKLEILRIQDASTRREPLLRKIGAGVSVDEFHAAVADGEIRLTGLKESLMMIGSGLGTEFERITDETIEPIVADREINTHFHTIRPGQVAGVHQAIFGHGPIDVSFELRIFVGAGEDAVDRVIVTGTPNLHFEIKGGVHGDRATAAMAVNCIPRILNARPGVLTMDDIPISFR